MISDNDKFELVRWGEMQKTPKFRFIMHPPSKETIYMVEFTYCKIYCECGKIKRLIFQGSKNNRDDKLEIIINSSDWISGKIPALDQFCRGYCEIKLG